MRNYLEKVLLTIPLLNDDGRPCGSMFRFIRAPKHIPQIGEEIYVLPDKYLKVAKVSYDGPGLRSIHLTLEPLLQAYQSELENLVSLKGADRWTKSTFRPK